MPVPGQVSRSWGLLTGELISINESVPEPFAMSGISDAEVSKSVDQLYTWPGPLSITGRSVILMTEFVLVILNEDLDAYRHVTISKTQIYTHLTFLATWVMTVPCTFSNSYFFSVMELRQQREQGPHVLLLNPCQWFY